MQIYNWTTRPQEEFQHVAAAGIHRITYRC